MLRVFCSSESVVESVWHFGFLCRSDSRWLCIPGRTPEVVASVARFSAGERNTFQGLEKSHRKRETMKTMLLHCAILNMRWIFRIWTEGRHYVPEEVYNGIGLDSVTSRPHPGHPYSKSCVRLSFWVGSGHWTVHTGQASTKKLWTACKLTFSLKRETGCEAGWMGLRRETGTLAFGSLPVHCELCL